MTIAMGNGNANTKGMNFDGGIMTIPADKYAELLEAKIKYDFLINWILNQQYAISKEDCFNLFIADWKSKPKYTCTNLITSALWPHTKQCM